MMALSQSRHGASTGEAISSWTEPPQTEFVKQSRPAQSIEPSRSEWPYEARSQSCSRRAIAASGSLR